MSTTTNPLQALANAIAQEEGYNVSGSLPQRLNNPGSLTDATTGSLIQFPDAQTGWQALVSKLQNIASGNSKVYSPSMTLEQFENTYTGGDPNAANNLSSILGVPKSTSLSSIFGGAGATSTTPASSSSSKSSSSSSTGGFGDNAISFLTGLFGGGDPLDTSQYLIRGVAIAGGLILITGAVFGFDSVRETVITTAKKGAEVAATAAA